MVSLAYFDLQCVILGSDIKVCLAPRPAVLTQEITHVFPKETIHEISTIALHNIVLAFSLSSLCLSVRAHTGTLLKKQIAQMERLKRIRLLFELTS